MEIKDDKATVKNLTAIIRLLEQLGHYLTEDARERILAITMLQNGPEAEHIEYLVALKRKADTLTEKLNALRGLNVFSSTIHHFCEPKYHNPTSQQSLIFCAPAATISILLF